MTSKRKQLHLQDGADDKLDVIVTDAGASMTYDGTKSMTFTASAFKFRQQGQTQDTDLFAKIAAVEETIGQNLGSNSDAIDALNTDISDANTELGEAEDDLAAKNTAADTKFQANQQRIADEESARQTALSSLDNKFSKDFAGSGDAAAGLLHTLNAEMLTERGRIDQETKESETASEQGDRQKAINAAKSAADTAIGVQKGRVDTVTQQLANLFLNIPEERLKNLATLIQDYKDADSSITNTLSQSRDTLDRMRNVIDTTFPPINRYAFAPGIIPQGPTGSEYVDVRMVFTQYTPHRFIVASETNYLTSVHKDSIWAVDPDDLRYQTFDWRITWIESEQAYDIINIDNNNYSLAQFYLTAIPSTGIPLALSSITNKYFDIETVSVGSDIVCRIKSKENSTYVSFSDLWSTTDTYQSNPGNDSYGALDPVIFESLLTTDIEKQYVQFASTTSPYDVYSP